MFFLKENDSSFFVQQSFAALMITKQPFPKPVKQKAKSTSHIEDPTVVELIKAPKADCKPVGPVRAQLIHEDYKSQPTSMDITNDQQEMDENGYVSFTELRFPSGTRQKMVRLQFCVQVRFVKIDGTIGTEALESDTSQPFVILTNENQWKVSEGLLLKKDIFDIQKEATWFKVRF
jgi:hypothetical protein